MVQQKIKKNGKIYELDKTFKYKDEAQKHSKYKRDDGWYACMITKKVMNENRYHVYIRKNPEFVVTRQPTPTKAKTVSKADKVAVAKYVKGKLGNKQTWINAIKSHMDKYKVKEVHMDVTFPGAGKKTISIIKHTWSWSLVLPRKTNWHTLNVLSTEMLKQITSKLKSKNYKKIK